MAPATATTSPCPPSAMVRPRARAELSGLPVERLEAEVIGLSARMAAGTYELLVLVGELDARGSWAQWGALSCAACRRWWIWPNATRPDVSARPSRRGPSATKTPTPSLPANTRPGRWRGAPSPTAPW